MRRRRTKKKVQSDISENMILLHRSLLWREIRNCGNLTSCIKEFDPI
jgi:hypothetical protein